MIRWLFSIGVTALLLLTGVAHALPLTEPVLDSDVNLRADRATVVQVGQTKLLLLEGDVSVTLGSYGFRDQRAIIRITRRPGAGPAVRDLAFVFEKPESIGAGGVQADGAGLLVTAASRGKIKLSAELSKADALPESELATAAIMRFADYDAKLAQPRGDVPQNPALSAEQKRLRDQRRAEIKAERRKIDLTSPGATQRTDDELVDRPVLPARGTVRYGSVDRIVYQRGETEDAVILIGGVRVMYEDEDEGRDILLTAEKIVIFMDKKDGEDTPSGQIDAGRIRGVYLEDSAVVTDGNTSVRAPRAYYDLAADRAILLDAVVYSYDLRYRVPLYMRADVIRQTSADSFTAEDAVFTTSEFAQPHLSIGASKITLQQTQRTDGGTDSWITAEGLTVNSGKTPFFYWPKATVRAGAIPIRRVSVGYAGNNGAEVQTTWDLFALTNTRAPEGVDLLGNIDYRGEHGLGLGIDLDYELDIARGSLDGYFLPSDSGTDELAQRADVGFNNDTRGFFRAQHRQELPAGWELWLEANYVSDPTFLEEFFQNEAYAQRAYETSAYFKKAEDDWALTALIKGETNSFTPQYAPLLTPGYTVNKLPEAEYRIMTSVFDDSATLFHESRLGRMRLVYGSDSPADRGFNAAQSAAAFGLAPNTSFDAAALAAGQPTSTVTRADSRTELSAALRAGVFDVTPFAVGRVTLYDDNFAALNGGNDDQARLWGGLGVRASTQISRATSSFSSELFDVQGIRHIIEPGVTLAAYDGTLSSSALPVYDPEVERLTEGGVARFGILNTWQTKRGGLGRQRTVDWVTLRTDLVLVGDDPTNNRSLGRYYDYRPEYTLGDDHFYGELMWAVTEATAMTGEITYEFDRGSAVQWRTGIENRHSERLTSQINYREIEALDARLLSYGASLQLTTKYRVGIFQVIDFGEGNSQILNLSIDRRIPRATIGLNIGYDQIDGEATISIVISPDGTGLGAGTGGLLGR